MNIVYFLGLVFGVYLVWKSWGWFSISKIDLFAGIILILGCAGKLLFGVEA